MLKLLGITAIASIVVGLLAYETKRQRDFEERITEEWEAMTEEERLSSGRENKYC